MRTKCPTFQVRFHQKRLNRFYQPWARDSVPGLEKLFERWGTRPWGPSRKRVPKYLKGPKTTYSTIAIAEKQSKRSKKGPIWLYIGSPRVPPRKWNLWGPEGKVPPGPPPPPRFLQPCSVRWLGPKLGSLRLRIVVRLDSGLVSRLKTRGLGSTLLEARLGLLKARLS